MSKAAFTIHCFGVYMMLAGVVSFVAGPWLLPALGLPGADVWWRCFGALAVILGAYYLVAARHEVAPLFRAMAWGRLAFALFIVVEAALHRTPLLLSLVVPDVLGALWTLSALKASVHTSASSWQPVSSQPLSSQPLSSQPLSSQPSSSGPLSSQPSGAPSSRSRTARDAWRLREPPT